MTTLPAISIRQPWAWAILNAGKNIENRSWPTKHRGPILIHASLAKSKSDRTAFIETALRMGINPEVWFVHDSAYQRGGIVGVVTVIDCVQNHSSPWAIPGQWHWVLDDPKPLPFFACKGRLGIFKVEIPEGSL